MTDLVYRSAARTRLLAEVVEPRADDGWITTNGRQQLTRLRKFAGLRRLSIGRGYHVRRLR